MSKKSLMDDVSRVARMALCLSCLLWCASGWAATALTGVVWDDTDGDGIQDGGELGVADVTVNVYLDGGTEPEYTDTTNVSGEYSFSLADDLDYVIEVILPEGKAFSAQDQGADDDVDSDFDMDGSFGPFTATGAAVDYDAGLIDTTTVSGIVWEDTDGDGIRDAGEDGIADVVVEMHDADSGDATVATATTAADGTYTLNGFALPLANAYLEVTLPSADYGVSPLDQGADDTVDSDFDPADNQTATFAIDVSDELTNYDAGLYEQVTIGGRVWDDTDGDGIRDSGEEDLSADATVTIYSVGDDGEIGGGDDVEEYSEDTAGTYSYADAAPGEYYVEVTAPAGHDFVMQDRGSNDSVDSDVDPDTGQSATFTVVSGDDDVTIDAGLAAFGSISGRVWLDENEDGLEDGDEDGVPNISISLYLAGDDGEAGTSDDEFSKSSTTNVDGEYTLSGVVAGTYYVRFALPAGLAFTEKDVDDDDTIDSDASRATGRTAAFDLEESGTITDVDAGALTDTDSDGVADSDDGCPNDVNKTEPGECGCGELETDSDGDGIPNCVDNCPYVDNDDQEDTDGDGVGDECDNCPAIANADQSDANEDGVGDVCETDVDDPNDSGDGDDDTDDGSDDNGDDGNDPNTGNADPNTEPNDTTDTTNPPTLVDLMSQCGLCGPIGMVSYGLTVVGYGGLLAVRRHRRR